MTVSAGMIAPAAWHPTTQPAIHTRCGLPQCRWHAFTIVFAEGTAACKPTLNKCSLVGAGAPGCAADQSIAATAKRSRLDRRAVRIAIDNIYHIAHCACHSSRTTRDAMTTATSHAEPA